MTGKTIIRSQVFAVISLGGLFDWTSGPNEEDIRLRSESEGFDILEWCETEEACARSINARLAEWFKERRGGAS